MATNNTLKQVRQRNYLARDFDGFRTVLLDYARQYYPDRIQDFSESSVGGLFLDMAAYVGDNMSFYLDHLYGELNTDTVVETANMERLLRAAGVPIVGVTPATVTVDFFIEVPCDTNDKSKPAANLLPTIEEGTVVVADNGTKFTLMENVRFWVSNADGSLSLHPDADNSNGRFVNTTSGPVPISRVLRMSGMCTSSAEETETFQIAEFKSFRRITLSQDDVTEIVSVSDGLGNTYYEVGNLTHDVVYKSVTNNAGDETHVKEFLKVIPAPYRFVKEVSLVGRKTSMIMGGATADTLEDDIIPDPADFAIPLPYSKTFSRTPVNPQKMLQTATLGVCGINTNLTVTYRYGGGLSHNVPANTINSPYLVKMVFPTNPSSNLQYQVKNSLEITNPNTALGGEDAPSIEQLMALIPTMKNSQERMVTKEDLLARVYTMPNSLGRVFRAAVGRNPANPLAGRLYIISRDSNNYLMYSPDTLKRNVRTYLNAYRMISDAIDVHDAIVVNLSLYFEIVTDPAYSKSNILQIIIGKLISQFATENSHIGQPIIVADVLSTIYSTQGVLSVPTIMFDNMAGSVNGRAYSAYTYNVQNNMRRQIIYPPEGGIFEIRYPDVDIVGRAVSNV